MFRNCNEARQRLKIWSLLPRGLSYKLISGLLGSLVRMVRMFYIDCAAAFSVQVPCQYGFADSTGLTCGMSGMRSRVVCRLEVLQSMVPRCKMHQVKTCSVESSVKRVNAPLRSGHATFGEGIHVMLQTNIYLFTQSHCKRRLATAPYHPRRHILPSVADCHS